MKWRCKKCGAEGFASRIIYICPVNDCGGDTEIVLDHFQERKEQAKLAIAAIESLGDLPDVMVICPFHKLCSIKDCMHADKHIPLEFEHTNCRHYSRCLEYNSRCIPV